MSAPSRRILVIDVGGTHVKLLATGQRTPVHIVSGPGMTPGEMVTAVRAAAAHWKYDFISIGYPGPVMGNGPAADPAHLGHGWVGFGYAEAFERPVKIMNDAAMQALGGYRGGRMLFLGLGTGLGSALVVTGHLQPLELAHLPYRKKRTFEDYVSDASLAQRGQQRWRQLVVDTATRLKSAMQADHLLIGGGNARLLRGHLQRLPEGTRLGGNGDAFRGGRRIWLPAHERHIARGRRGVAGKP